MPAQLVERKNKNRNPETIAARQLFLYGEGDGVRVLDLKELSQKSGAAVSTLRLRLPEWEAEYEEIVKSSSKLANAGSPSILSLPQEVFEHHNGDLSFIRERLDKLKAELTALPSMISDLRTMISDFAADPEKIDEAMTLLEKYLRTSANEKRLLGMFSDVKKLWDSKVGLDSIKSIAEAHAKALKPTEKADEPSPTGENVSVFRR